MTTYAAYDAGLPCKNPHCKSVGKPHPNCRCYGDMADGGEVEAFCLGKGPHQPECEYFAEGGVVGMLGAIDPTHAVAGHISSNGLLGLHKMHVDHDLEKYERSVKRGHKDIESEIERLFAGGRPAKEDRSRHHKAIDDWIAKGGITHNIQQEVYNQHESPQSFAEGGMASTPREGVLHDHPIEHVYPEHNIMLQTAKGRASNYLSSLRPQEHVPKLAFDEAPDQSVQKKKYAKAVKIADAPLSILHDVTHGTLVPDQIQHLKAMYPEVLDAVQKKVTEKIIKSQLAGKKPSAKVRQSLSLLMGTSLSGAFTPQNITAAQSVFAGAKHQQQSGSGEGPQKAKKNAAPLSKSEKSFLTGSQALIARQQRTS